MIMLKMGIYAIYPKPNLQSKVLESTVFISRDYTVSFRSGVVHDITCAWAWAYGLTAH